MIAVFDLARASIQAIREAQDRTSVPLHSLGYQFIGLADVFKNIHHVGYFTDKDLSVNSTDSQAIAQYEQAQYMLAPTVLDINQTQYHWVIFDCTNPLVAIEAIKKLGFTPVKAHNGIILTYNPNGI